MKNRTRGYVPSLLAGEDQLQRSRNTLMGYVKIRSCQRHIAPKQCRCEQIRRGLITTKPSTHAFLKASTRYHAYLI